MPRAFWKGVISFGLVAIPVKMYVGAESKTLSFHLLHKKCLTRPKQVLHCETDNEYFGIKDTVRGKNSGLHLLTPPHAGCRGIHAAALGRTGQDISHGFHSDDPAGQGRSDRGPVGGYSFRQAKLE